MENTLDEFKASLIGNIEKRVEDKVIESQNGQLLIRLIKKAESTIEANEIYTMGTQYKPTGFHYDLRLEKNNDDTIYYFKKNEELSFSAKDKDSLTHKLIIGNNYKALLNLIIEYKGRIDVIYIDPPYGVGSMGEHANTLYENSITRDNLLSMLHTRLNLAKELLSDTGVIFCSIDDRNQAYVKCLFDSVFGEQNSAGMMIWQKKKKPSFLSSNFATKFEYVLAYVKNKNNTFPFSIDTTTAGKKYPFNNAGNSKAILKFPANTVHFNMPDCLVEAQDMSEGNIYTKLLNDVQIVDGYNNNPFELEGEWRYSQASLDEFVANQDVITISNVPFRPNLVKKGGEVKKMDNLLSPESCRCETNEDGSNTLNSIMGMAVFDNPKPVGLIETLLRATTYDNKNAVVLDFFAGSGTTGQAVLELNKSDKGKRKFILVQLDEELKLEKAQGKAKTTIENAKKILEKQQLPINIASITNERLRRIMTGKANDGSNNFEWLQENSPYGDGLDVYNIESVSAMKKDKGQSAFDVIDETLYGREKLSIKDKIEWVCSKFEETSNDDSWERIIRGKADAE